MIKEDLLRDIADLCTRYEVENGGTELVGCFVDLGKTIDDVEIYEYNGKELQRTMVRLEKVPLDQDRNDDCFGALGILGED